MHTSSIARQLARGGVVLALVLSSFAVAGVAQAASTCGTSGGHTVCVTVPSSTLTGATTVTITNSPNTGTLIARWIASGRGALSLITEFAPSPATNDYTFVWPTQKYVDAGGVLRVQAGSTSSAPVDVAVTLANGNATNFQHSPNDWQDFLPDPSWSAARDPIVAAVGDGASNEPASNQNADAIAASSPDLFLYLGDIYEDGTFTENLNHYGENSMDGGAGTLWGQMGTITQPAIGDHEVSNRTAWHDYFHGRPLYTSFRFGNVLFLDLASTGESMAAGSAQYNWVKAILTDPSTPACVVAYFQNPALAKDRIKTKNGRADMWALLTDNGGDLVLNGNTHTMLQYKPLNDKLQLPSSGQPTMVELIAGSGGHKLGGTYTSDQRVEWSKGKTPGAVYVTLNGAANGGVPTGLSWAYKDTKGNVLHAGTRSCGDGPPPPPSGLAITGFNPTSGPVGTSVQITGNGFTGASDVSFGGASAGTYTVDSDTQITATVPSSAVTGPISVTTGADTATSSTDFTVTSGGGGGVLAISGFTPTSGPPGTAVTITGSAFTDVTIVKFNGVKAPFTVDSDTQITATVPSSATTGPIKVKDPLGAVSSSTDFTVTSGGGGGVLAISGFTPTSGPPGTAVTITGSAFTDVTIVKFNGVKAQFTVDSDTQITATVPNSTTTGPIKVKDGIGAATSSTDFTVT